MVTKRRVVIQDIPQYSITQNLKPRNTPSRVAIPRMSPPNWLIVDTSQACAPEDTSKKETRKEEGEYWGHATAEHRQKRRPRKPESTGLLRTAGRLGRSDA